jgi:NADH-quinone oxidoreductase subunit E
MTAMEKNKYELSAHLQKELDGWIARFPEGRQRSAVISGLRLAQHENGGHLTPAIMDAVAKYLDLPPVQAYEIATFYSMLETEKVGRHSVSVCKNISCMLRGADDIVRHIEKKLGCQIGKTTDDGRIYLKNEQECLAACCGAPMMMVDHQYFENLTAEKVDEILDGLE